MCKPSKKTENNRAMVDDSKDLWVFDGGTGREIERRGGPFRQPEWSALALYEDPTLVRDIHQSFIKAGATAITTNTYAVVPFHLGQERYNKDREWLLQSAVEMALQAKGGRNNIQVLGSIPPISGSYQPGSFDESIAGPIIRDFLNAFRGKVDAIILETMGSAQEAKFALEQIYQSNIQLPVYLSFYVRNDARLLTGDTLKEAIDYLRQFDLLQPDRVPLVMINCCDINVIEDSLCELAMALDTCQFRIGAYPNAFSAPPSAAANVKAREVDGNVSPEVLQSLACKWIGAYGASVIGGCCGIGPDHITAVAQLKKEGLVLPATEPRIEPRPGDVLATEPHIEPRLDDGIAVESGGRSDDENIEPNTTRVACNVRGCGCGVQIGFGQQLLLCQHLDEADR
ncbi:Homocysteine S-methyltransferase 3 [Seminavis robusta]|uniref:Homocysteine S-methyltransferase 3 n=1 Tax=Seminavis robusta TaxID=568900 RepID=A0A9N8HLK8_9STRA|nr:Homocysteine S-methyltransferase 3 [Seminavis robusta]|eukprot:Sro817_g206750.1 Homocysteine S-methyltransferase 3 (399) ;mRNA; f:2524-3720